MIFLCKIKVIFNHILTFVEQLLHLFLSAILYSDSFLSNSLFFILYTAQSLLVGLSEFLDAFLVNFLVREQSGLLHHGEQLLPGELIQVDAVQDHLFFLRLANFVSRIPHLEKSESVLR